MGLRRGIAESCGPPAPAQSDRTARVSGSPHRRGSALVLGRGTALLGVVRSLGRAGVEVHVAWHDEGDPALRSRYIAETHPLARPHGAGEEWKGELLGLMRARRFDLVIPCEDETMLPLAAHRAELERAGRGVLSARRARPRRAAGQAPDDRAGAHSRHPIREVILRDAAGAGGLREAFALPVILGPGRAPTCSPTSRTSVWSPAPTPGTRRTCCWRRCSRTAPWPFRSTAPGWASGSSCSWPTGVRCCPSSTSASTSRSTAAAAPIAAARRWTPTSRAGRPRSWASSPTRAWRWWSSSATSGPAAPCCSRSTRASGDRFRSRWRRAPTSRTRSGSSSSRSAGSSMPATARAWRCAT